MPSPTDGTCIYYPVFRREWLQVDGLGVVGLTLPHLLNRTAQAADTPRARQADT